MTKGALASALRILGRSHLGSRVLIDGFCRKKALISLERNTGLEIVSSLSKPVWIAAIADL